MGRNGYQLGSSASGEFTDPAWSVEVSGDAHIAIRGDRLTLRGNYAVSLRGHTTEGVEIQHLMTVEGEASAQVEAHGDQHRLVVSIVEADTSALRRSVTTTRAAGTPAIVPDGLADLGDLFDQGFEVDCRFGSSGMMARTTDPSGLTLYWAVIR